MTTVHKIEVPPRLKQCRALPWLVRELAPTLSTVLWPYALATQLSHCVFKTETAPLHSCRVICSNGCCWHHTCPGAIVAAGCHDQNSTLNKMALMTSPCGWQDSLFCAGATAVSLIQLTLGSGQNRKHMFDETYVLMIFPTYIYFVEFWVKQKHMFRVCFSLRKTFDPR